MISFRALTGSSLVALLGAAALALLPSTAMAGTYGTLAAFQANVHADTLLEPFNGADAIMLPPIAVSGNGYAYTMSTTGAQQVFRFAAFGVGAQFSGDQGRIAFTGRPVSAIAGTFHVITPGLVGTTGQLDLLTNTGESFSVAIPAAGAFFGITTTVPFTSVTFTVNNGGATYESVDDLIVGVSGTAAEASDQCADAVSISPITTVQYPFTTVGATAEAISGVCDGATDTGPDVWFRFIAPVHGMVTFSTCGCTFDSILRVFPSCPVGGSGAGQIACNDDFCNNSAGINRASQVSFRAVAGEDYLIRISGYNGVSGSGNLTFSIVPDCRADFNHNGGREVQDIFDFLASWFGGC